MKKIIMIIFVLIVAYGASHAQTPKVVTSDKTGWHKIGETSVDFKRDRDAVDILGANRFAAIRFRVDDAPIDLIGAEVYYESGDKQDLKVSASIKPPGETEVFNLNGGERTVKKIVFIYKTIPNYHDKMAHVEIWGLKTNTPR